MNEEALQQLYTLAQGEGYSKSFDDFKVLMGSNEDALNNMYTVSQSEGYKNSIDDFKVLVGFGAQPEIAQEETITEDPLKKKEDTESVSADGLSESPKTDFLDFTQMASSPMLEQAQQEEMLQQKEQGVEFSESPKFLEYQIDELEEKIKETVKPLPPQKERVVKYDRYGDVMYDSAITDELEREAAQIDNAFETEPIREEIKDLQLKLDGTKAGFRAQPSFKEVYQEAYDPETKTLNKQKLTEMGVEIPILFNNDFFQGMMGSNFSEARDLYNGYVEDYYDSKKEAAGYVYVNGEYVDPESPMPGYGFDAAMDAIKFGGIVSREEEESVGRLNNMFNQYGFRFSQSGGGDNLTAVGPDGKQLKFFGEEELSLDNWTSATDKKYGAELKRVMANAYEAAEFTDEEMFKQAMTKPSDPNKVVENEVVAGIATRASSWSKQATSRINNDAKRLKDLMVLMNSQEILAEGAIKNAEEIRQRDFKDGLWSSYEAEDEYNKLIKEANDISEVYKVTHNAASKMDANLRSDVNQITRYEGDRAMMMADMWDLNNVPALLAQSIGEGAGGLISGVYGAADFAFSNMINLASGYDETSAGYQTDEMQRERKASVSKQLREGLGSLATGGAITDAKTSAETIAAIKSLPYLSSGGGLGILMSVSESIPAMVSGMGAFGFAAFQMDGLANEMNNIPEFKNISENEKMLILAPVAIVSGVLENFGFRNAINKSSLVGRLTVGALKKFGAQTAKEGTKRTFKEIVERSVMNKISKGALLTVSGTAAEMETEAAQQFSETWMKEIYDLAKGQDFFKQSIDISKGIFMNMEFAKEIAKAAYAGAIGGAVIGAPSAYAGAVKNNSIVEISDAAFNLFTMTTTPESIERTLAVQRAAYNAMVGVETNPETGQKFTQKEVDDTLLQYEYLLGQKNEINSNWDAKSQKQVLALLMEKKNLEQSIEGLDKNTTKDQQREIEILKEDIEVISSAANKNYEQVLKKEYEKAKKEGFTGTIEAFKFRESVEKAAKEKQAPVKEEVAEETTVTEEVTEEAPVTEEERTAMQEALETQPITKITTDLVAKEKKGELTQEETDGVLLGIMEKIEAENAKRKTPLSPEQAQKKLGKMQQRVFEGNKQRYLELSGVMPAAQEQVVEETPVVEEAPVKEAPVVEEEELEFGENTFVYKMRISTTPSGRGKWEADFEIVDNRPNEQGIRNDNSSDANWMVLNKITGEMLEATSKKDAQGIIKNAPAEAGIFGEGQQLDFTQLTPSQQKKFKKQFETQKVQRKRKKIAEKFSKKLAEESAKKEAPKRKRRKKKVVPVVKEAPVKEEAKISEEVQKEIKRAEGTRDSIVGPLKTKLDKTRGFEQKEEIRDEIQQTKKKYNNIITELKEGKRTQFQLEAETTSEQTKQKLEDEAVKLLDNIIQENNGDISESPWTAEQPAPGAEIITIEVKENSELAKKVRKMGLGELVGKKINLVMADQLKVDKKRMGGPFFPLIDKLFGKVAWASMRPVDATKIINGAIKSDYTVVYNMATSAIDSNSIMGETLVELLEDLPESQRQEVFELMKENVTKSKAKDFVRIKEVFEKSNTLPQALKGLKELGVDERAALLKKVVPSRDVTAKTPIGAKLQENNITIEALREINTEQFVSELPAGAMTMVLEVTDKAGNKITEETKDEAMITPEQQKEEGLPQHPNYDIYIRGKAIGILTETTPFYNMLKDVARNIEVKIAGIVRQKSGRKMTSKEARSAEMRSAMGSASRARTTQAPQASRYQQFVSVLKRSFPSVEVVTTQAEFDTLLKETGAKQLTTKGQKVYGAVYQGKLYLNPSLENYNTPIHEFGHVWMNVAKEANRKLYEKGLSLVKGSKYEQDVLNNKAYQKVIKQMRKDGASEQEINDYIQEEALATAIGDKGESFVSASRNKSFKDWLSTLYGFVRKLTGISKYTSKQLEDITLDEFTQAVAVDLLSGRQLFEGAEITDMSVDLQLQIIGENAQVSQQIRDNLSIARAMEKNNSSPKDIRLATDWEKGADGKWRYEIGDIQSKVKISNSLFNYFSNIIKRARGLKTNEALLSDFLNYPELFEAYPQLKNIKVVLDNKSSSTLGYFNAQTNTITLNTSERSLDSLELKGTLLHEVQHAIQKIEGFSTGGNLMMAENIILPEALKDKQERLDKLYKEIDTITKSVDEKLKKIDGYDTDIAKRLTEKYSDIINEEYLKGNYKFNPHTKEEQAILDNNLKLSETVYSEARKKTEPLIQEANKLQKEIETGKKNFLNSMSEEQRSNLTEEAYLALAGEVESRNVQERMGMTQQERREKLLQETEDVAREDQNIFMGDQASVMASMAEKGVDLDAAMNESINQMIDKGFKAAEIKGVLQQMGYKARAINDALVVKIDADMKLPNEFANIDGGVREGETMFRSVMQKLKEFAAPKLVKRSIKEQYNEAKKDGYEGTLKEYTEEQNNKKIEMLKQANPALAILTNEEILERYPNIQNEVIEKQQKSRAEIRAKAIELLEAEAAFQSQDNLTQLKLIESLDRTMKTRSNKSVQKKINAIKQTLKGVREGVKDLQAAKKRIKNLIREELLPMGVSITQANNLVRIVEKATKETYESSVAEVMKVVEAQTSKKKKETIEKMLKLAKQKSTVKNKRARTSPEAARFFKQATVILNALSKNNTEKLETIEEELRKKEAEINEIIDKINDGIEVTDEQQELVAFAQAFDILGSLNKQDLSETQDALNLMKSELESGMESLRTRRAARKAIYDRLREEANESIKAGYEFLFDEDGKPLTDAELKNRRSEIWNQVTGIKSLVKAVNEYYTIALKPKTRYFVDYLKHLGTLTNGLDRKGDFFKKNIYDRLNNMEESYLQGYFNTIDLLSSELESIGIKGGYDGLSKIINDGLIRNEKKTIKGIKLDLKGKSMDLSISKAEAMRLYSLSKNTEQRNRLKQQGFTDVKMQQIEEFLGEQLVQAADKVVDVLSTSYYESVNKVYEDVNDVSLPFIENYFPTRKARSLTSKTEAKQLESDLNSGNFAGVFSAQQASALKERKSDEAVDIVGQDFSSVLEEHIRSMERFKAYAMGTKEINIIINHTDSVGTVLEATNLKETISNGIMYAINPNAMQDYFELKNKWFTNLQRKFVGVTLALKFIQLPKQASSFVNAFADYKLRQNNRIPGVDFALDVIGFTLDTAYTLATFRSTYREAMKSASFRNRIRESFKTADLLGLETGLGTRSRVRKTKLGRALRKAKVVANSPTLVGDVMGVMGYMSAQRANKRNGMSEQEAIEKFNAYNETQQTRRPTEKVGIQRSNSIFARSFTMFGSTFYLQLNKIMQAVTNIRRDGANSLKLVGKGEFKNAYKQSPTTKDYRELVLNLAIANFLFTSIANAFKYNPFMDDDDEITEEEMERIKKAQNALKRGKEVSDEDMKLIERYQFQLDKNAVIRSYKESLFGLNQLYNLPLIGPGAKMVVDFSVWNDPNAFSSDRVRQVNPLTELVKEVGRDAVWNNQSIAESAINPLISFAMGIPVEKPLALVDRIQSMFGDDEMYREGFEELNDKGERKFKGTFEDYKAKQMEENMYELMGISYSYRPGSGKDWTKKKMTITIDEKSDSAKAQEAKDEKQKKAIALRKKKRNRKRKN